LPTSKFGTHREITLVLSKVNAPLIQGKPYAQMN
jgi:hypothetical protein